MKNMNIETINDDEFDLICEYIKLRNESNISQSELARRVGIARSTIARMERNLHSISLGTFIKLLEVMNYKLEIIKKEEKNDLIELTKTFENEKIRTVWNKDEEKYYISVVDIVDVLTESDNPNNYWKVLKHRLKEEGNQSVTNCNQLKLKSSDGKFYKTDVVDIEGMFRLIESIPSKKAEPIKLWLAHLGKERIDEEYDPEITINRALDAYRRKGYSDDWLNQRLNVIDARKEFTDELKNNGIESSKDFAILTDLLTKTWSGYSTKEYKSYKGLTKENLRDNMTNM